jgi:hypothetical protein
VSCHYGLFSMHTKRIRFTKPGICSVLYLLMRLSLNSITNTIQHLQDMTTHLFILSGTLPERQTQPSYWKKLTAKLVHYSLARIIYRLKLITHVLFHELMTGPCRHPPIHMDSLYKKPQISSLTLNKEIKPTELIAPCCSRL